MPTTPFGQVGRVALVTGAGSPVGIGLATARLLGRLGAQVVLAATTERVHDRATELGQDGVAASGFVGDLTDAAVAEALVETCLHRHGRLDVVVNNAGMTSAADPDTLGGDLLATDPERWRRSLARNLDTAYLVSRAALPHLRASGSGRLVLVSSVTGGVMAMRGEVAYATAKAGMVGLTRALAVDEGPHGVTVNAVAPGWVATGSQTDDEAREGLATRWDGPALPTRWRQPSPSSPAVRRPTSRGRCSSSTAATPCASSARPRRPLVLTRPETLEGR